MKKTGFNLNIIGSKKIFYGISIALISLTLIFSFVFGVKLSIEFSGGALINYSYSGGIDMDALNRTVNETIGQEATVQKKTNIATGSNSVDISIANSRGLSTEDQSKLTATLQETYSFANFELMSSNNVSASNGREFFFRCIVALILASVFIVVYVGFAFRKIGGVSAGVTSVIALLHDAIMVFATFVILRYPLDQNFIAVILTILGYSVNDTIVIFDRIRENERTPGNKLSPRELSNKSLNQVLSRTLYATITTVMALVVVCVVCVATGLTSMTSFVIPMTIGMISGSYSTICIAIPLWVDWKNHSDKKPGRSSKVSNKHASSVGKIRL
jgi:preprotein translocase subunit SecF